MRAIRYQPPEGRAEPRTDWMKFRVNPDERAHVEALAGAAGLKVGDYLRGLVGLAALKPGAPLGNQNRVGKPGVNQYTDRR